MSSNQYDGWWIILSLKLMAESTHLKIQVLIVDEFFVGATCLLSFFGMKDDDIWWNPTGVYCVFFGVRSFKQSTGLKGFSRGPQKASGHLSREVPRNPMRRFTGMLPHEDMIGKWFIAVGRFCTGPRPFARHKWGYINGPTCRIWITAFIAGDRTHLVWIYQKNNWVITSSSRVVSDFLLEVTWT